MLDKVVPPMKSSTVNKNLLKILAPAGVDFPSNSAEYEADLKLAFTYGLATGVFKPDYAAKLLRWLAYDNSWLFDLLRSAARKPGTRVDVAKFVLQDYSDIAKHVEENVLLE